MTMNTNKHTIIALVEDKPGVLNRIASTCRQRGFNIESLAVGRTESPGLSRMTFVVDAAVTDIEQVVKQINKIINVISIRDITNEETVMRELALLKIATSSSTRSQVIEVVDIFRANIVDVAPDSVIVEITGDHQKIDSFIDLIVEFGIKEMMRTGRIAVTRG